MPFSCPRFGYDKQGYNKEGYDKQGYNRFGKKIPVSNDVSIAAGIQRVQARITQKPRRPAQEEFHFISFKDSQVQCQSAAKTAAALVGFLPC